MRKRNILFFGLLIISLFVGLCNTKAKTMYTSYDEGDKIKVNVNSSKQLEFYVIENSDSQNVTAIYDGVLGETIWFEPTTSSLTGSAAETKLNELTSDWDKPREIRLIKISEINSDFKLSIDLDEDFTNPSYYNIGQSYWTQDVAVNGDKYYPIVVTSWMSYSNIHAVPSREAPSSTGYIRPVITIDKEYVVGGTYISEDETLWKNFVEEFKKTEIIKWLEESDKNTINITSTSNSLKVVLTESENTWETNFTYEDGVVTYVPSNNEENMIADGIWASNCIYALATLKGYDREKLDDWLSEERKFTLVNYGIEFEVKEITKEEESSELKTTLTVETYSSLKLDIKNGFKSFSSKLNEEKKETVKNPDTAISLGYGILIMLIVLSGFTCILIRKQSKFPRA